MALRTMRSSYARKTALSRRPAKLPKFAVVAGSCARRLQAISLWPLHEVCGRAFGGCGRPYRYVGEQRSCFQPYVSLRVLKSEGPACR